MPSTETTDYQKRDNVHPAAWPLTSPGSTWLFPCAPSGDYICILPFCLVLCRMSREGMSSQTHCPEGSVSQKSVGTSLRVGASKSHCLPDACAPWSCEMLREACLCPSKPPPLPLIHPCIPPFPSPCFDYLATVASAKQLL